MNQRERDENGFPIELNESVGNMPQMIAELSIGHVSYAAAQLSIDQALRQLIVLSGDEMGPSDKTWQDIASGAILNLGVLTTYLRQQLNGGVPFSCFPEVRIDETNPQSA